MLPLYDKVISSTPIVGLPEYLSSRPSTVSRKSSIRVQAVAGHVFMLPYDSWLPDLRIPLSTPSRPAVFLS
jgi:hypothetical protein